MQTLLGFANFYRNLIEDFSRLTNSLNRLLRKDTEWTWGKEQEMSFRKLKKRFTEKPVLATFDEDKQTILKVNASDYAMSACLTQVEKLIAYFSKTF